MPTSCVPHAITGTRAVPSTSVKAVYPARRRGFSTMPANTISAPSYRVGSSTSAPAVTTLRGGPQAIRSTKTARDRPVHLATLHALADRDALVVELLSLPEAQLRLRPALRPVQAQRHEREAPLLDPAAQAIQLPPVHQELPRPLRVVAELARGAV